MLSWLFRYWLIRQKWSRKRLKFFKDKLWVVAPIAYVDEDAQKVAMFNHGAGVRSGNKIGILKVLRYTRENPHLEWQKIADHFNFEELNAKYPK